MKTIKIIDLLNKIANGKEVPKKIKYVNLIWKYDEETKDYINNNSLLFYEMNSIGLTEREVEILEEEKKIPEKLDINLGMVNMTPTEKYISNTVNEIIDYLKSKGDE